MSENIKKASRRHKARLEKNHYGYIFIAPFFIIYTLFSLYPLVSTFFFSFAKKTAFVDEFTMVGLSNFTTVLGDSEFTKAMMNTPTMWIIGFIPQLIFALLFAAWFTNTRLKVRAQGLFKVIFYLPNIMTAATIGGLFFALIRNEGIIHDMIYNLFSPFAKGEDFLTQLIVSLGGPEDFISGIAKKLGAIDNIKKPLTGDFFSKSTVGFINFWMWYGNTMIVLIAGILGINPSIFEAANIDGATGGQIFRKITLPLIRPIMTYTLVTSLIGGFQMFDIPQQMTGDGSSIGKFVMTIVMYIRRVGLSNQMNVGVASAASVLLFLVTSVFSVLLFYMMRDRSGGTRRQKKGGTQ